MFEAAGSGQITTERVPVAALQRQLETATDSLATSFAGLMLQYAAGDSIDPTTSRRLFPFEKASVSDFIAGQLRT